MAYKIITYSVYAVCLLLILWGGKFAGFKKFHDDFMDLDVTKAVRGLAAIGVIMHHISQEENFQQARVMSIFVNSGFLFVAIFFFCSGYGLVKSLKTKPDYFKGFLRHRLPVLVVPFYVSVVLYTIFYFATGTRFAPVQWITNTLGLTMVNTYCWYVVVIILLYLIFYLVYKKIKSDKVRLIIMFAVVIIMGAIFAVNGHFAWWAGSKNWWLRGPAPKWWMEQKVFWFHGEWWVNSAIAFWLGLLFATNEEKITAWFKNLYWLKLPVVLVLTAATCVLSYVGQGVFGYWTEWSGNGPDIAKKFITFLLQMPYVIFFVVFVFMIMMKFHSSNPVTRFFGKISLETYMMNLMALTTCRMLYKVFPVRSWQYMVLYIVCVVALTIILALIYKAINSVFINLIRKPKKQQ